MSPRGVQGDGHVEIRVRNASTVDFDRVVVDFPDRARVDYGRVVKGADSEFQRTARAYRYAGIRITASGREWALSPIDYVGEQPLSAGRYTYVIGLDGDRVTLTLERGH